MRRAVPSPTGNWSVFGAHADMTGFNDSTKLGDANRALDFSKYRANSDDGIEILATPANTSCATSPPRAARAKARSTRPPGREVS
jgi:hypothetical protein